MRLCQTLRLLPMIFMMAVIFLLSHQPGDNLDMVRIPQADKIAHFLIYGLLALTVLFIPPAKRRQREGARMVVWAVVVAGLYGLTDEYHQSFIAGRESSLADIAADLCGAAAFSLFWLRNLVRARRGNGTG